MLSSCQGRLAAIYSIRGALDSGVARGRAQRPNAVADDVNPCLDGAGFAWDHLVVMLLWGAAAAVVAVRLLRNAPDDRPRRVAPATLAHRSGRSCGCGPPLTSG